MGWSLISTVYEVCFNNFGKGNTYVLLTTGQDIIGEKKKEHTLIPLQITICFLFLVVVIAQGRIEWYKRKKNHKISPTTETFNLLQSGDLKVARTSFTITVLGLILVLCWFLAAMFLASFDAYLFQLAIHCIVSSLLHNVMPLMVIMKTPKIRKYFMSKLPKGLVVALKCNKVENEIQNV